ncbi:MAG: hypothetical protein EAX96_05845 [Candidatus Lokiarchaeota archaeon]|nr:hypothetical protein [Candidatus Lokiarchaeota archaeon]
MSIKKGFITSQSDDMLKIERDESNNASIAKFILLVILGPSVFLIPINIFFYLDAPLYFFIFLFILFLILLPFFLLYFYYRGRKTEMIFDKMTTTFHKQKIAPELGERITCRFTEILEICYEPVVYDRADTHCLFLKVFDRKNITLIDASKKDCDNIGTKISKFIEKPLKYSKNFKGGFLFYNVFYIFLLIIMIWFFYMSFMKTGREFYILNGAAILLLVLVTCFMIGSNIYMLYDYKKYKKN